MNEKHEIHITARDKVMRAWENSTELTRDFKQYSKELENSDRELSETFAQFALEEGLHAARLRDILQHDQEKQS